ncbi:NAD-P-binding protein [Dentipellis sp. KUC8613]|nr:NAD-P-binding protein [Dentipellis sp. KUC8613]
MSSTAQNQNQNRVRVAIVTGGAQGIGRGIALRLAADGLDVAINDIEQNKGLMEKVVGEIQAMGRKAIAIPGDVTSEEAVESMVATTVQKLGRLDVMVANAGVGHGGVGLPHRKIFDTDLQNWRNMNAVNVEGVMLCYKHAARQMIKQGDGGRIIGAASMASKRGIATLGAYCASKFAVRGLTQCAALELSEYNITVNAYAPGVIETSLAHSKDGGIEKLKETVGFPHAKTGYPEDIAQWVSYIVSPGSHFITGQTTLLDGGLLFD